MLIAGIFHAAFNSATGSGGMQFTRELFADPQSASVALWVPLGVLGASAAAVAVGRVRRSASSRQSFPPSQRAVRHDQQRDDLRSGPTCATRGTRNRGSSRPGRRSLGHRRMPGCLCRRRAPARPRRPRRGPGDLERVRTDPHTPLHLLMLGCVRVDRAGWSGPCVRAGQGPGRPIGWCANAPARCR